MTIVEAITVVMKTSSAALTSKEIYHLIIEKKLYDFPAKNPESVVNGLIRRHCEGLISQVPIGLNTFALPHILGKPRATAC